MLVGADSVYAATRLCYDLLPLNVGVLVYVLKKSAAKLPAGSVIALYDTEHQYDDDAKHLEYGGVSIRAQHFGGNNGLDLYRVIAGSTP